MRIPRIRRRVVAGVVLLGIASAGGYAVAATRHSPHSQQARMQVPPYAVQAGGVRAIPAVSPLAGPDPVT